MIKNEAFYYDETYAEKADWCNQNGCHIKEIERDANGRRFVILENAKISEEQGLRLRRENECFSFVNRGSVWYDTLPQKQKEELGVWYKAWLDAPATKIVPQKPDWLK